MSKEQKVRVLSVQQQQQQQQSQSTSRVRPQNRTRPITTQSLRPGSGRMIFRTVVDHAKKHPGLIPQFFFISVGLGGAALYLLRLAIGPYVVWNKTNNPEPWNKLDPTFQYKFVAVNTDYKTLKKNGPEF